MKSRMTTFFIVLFIFSLFPQLILGDMLGAEAPNFSLKDLEGNTISLSEFYGKVIVLLHFNVYCHTCQEEEPLINRIHREYKDLQIIGIAIGNDNKEVLDFTSKFKPKFLIVPDPQKEVFKTYHVTNVPFIDIIDKTGTIRYRGKLTNYNAFKSVLEGMTQEKEVVGPDLWSVPPNFTLIDSEGTEFQLYDIIGDKTILLTFFSVNDPTVRQIIEIMKALYNKYKREDLDMIRIAVRNSLEEVRNFKKAYYVTFPILVDEKGEIIPDLSTLGALAVGVPGAIDGLFEIHKLKI